MSAETIPPPVDVAPSSGDGSRTLVVSWALYDLGNTIYSAIVMTAFLPLIFEERYGSLTPLGLTTSGSLLASALISTRLGTYIDRTGRARPGLDLWTNVCVGFTVLLYFAAGWGMGPTLLCYAASLFGYQAALTFYNALLPVVAPPHRRGFVSGLGTGLGYGGIPLALLIGQWVMGTSLGMPGTFLVSAILMTLGTIPLWLKVKDPPVHLRPPREAKGGGLVASLRWVRTQPILMLLLLANFVSADVANTLIQYATLYFKSYAGMTPKMAVYMMMAISVTALVGGLVVGRLADRARPALIYAISCTGLIVGLVVAALLPGRWYATTLLIVTGGIGVATIWTIGRQLVLRVAPPDRYGEALGLYGVTTKASIVGTTVFAVLRDAFGYAEAILVQAAVLTLGVILILRLDRRLTADSLRPAVTATEPRA